MGTEDLMQKTVAATDVIYLTQINRRESATANELSDEYNI